MASKGSEKSMVLDGATIGSPGDRTICINNSNGNWLPVNFINYFLTFGDIDVIYKHKNNLQTYITFMEEDAMMSAVKQSKCIISGVEVEIKPQRNLLNNSIFVSGFYKIKKRYIKMHFEEFGQIIRIDSPKSPNEELAIEFCYVQFTSERAAFMALLANNNPSIDGNEVRVTRTEPHRKPFGNSPVLANNKASYTIDSDDNVEDDDDGFHYLLPPSSSDTESGSENGEWHDIQFGTEEAAVESGK